MAQLNNGSIVASGNTEYNIYVKLDEIGELSNLTTSGNTNLVGATNEVLGDLNTHKADYAQDKADLLVKGSGQEIETFKVTFNPDGTSKTMDADVIFPKPFSSKPDVFPGNAVTASSSWDNKIMYPFISAVSTTGFHVQISSYNDTEKFGSGTFEMMFMAIGN